jgi:hypothetical protein
MTKTPYILSLKGGKDNSPEGLQVCSHLVPSHVSPFQQLADSKQNGMTHGFVLEFASAEDRDYYVATDPAHQEFVKNVGEVVEKPTVLDFSDGVY